MVALETTHHVCCLNEMQLSALSMTSCLALRWQRLLMDIHRCFFFRCCFTSTETRGIRLFGGGEPQDGHLDFHTAPGLTIVSAHQLSMFNSASMDLCMATSIWFLARRGAALTLAIIAGVVFKGASVINKRLTKCLQFPGLSLDSPSI